MTEKKARKKIVKYPRFFGININIGTVLFGILFIYIVICFIMYLTSTHVSAYEVREGSLNGNYRYTALTLKAETLITAPESGNITYYAREGSKIGNGSTVCSIQEGQTSAANTETAETEDGETQINTEAISRFRTTIKTYSSNYDRMSFQNVYNFEADLITGIWEMATEDTTNGVLSSISSSGLVNACNAPTEGIVVYAEDGYEEKTVSDLVADDFSMQNYLKNNLRTNETVKSGDVIYKLITDENWTLVIQLDKDMYTKLNGEDTVRFRFLKDQTAFNADFTVYQSGSNYYGALNLDFSVIRFATDRYVDIELLLNQKNGLKIPNTAVVERSFYKIPIEYASYDEDSPNEVRIIKEVTDKDGNTTTQTITATVYDKTETDFLIDSSLFDEGDSIIMNDSMKRYTISETESMQGVYNINKGYAVFREIKIIDENEEYCIVEEGSTFGLSQYDHIALDGSTITDNQII